jgi:broad specificity phosphatase PhoE
MRRLPTFRLTLEPRSILVLTRHGQSEWNKLNLVSGVLVRVGDQETHSVAAFSSPDGRTLN